MAQRSTWITTASVLATGAAAGALMTYLAMKPPKRPPRKVRRLFRSQSNIDTIQAESLDENYHLPQSVNAPTTIHSSNEDSHPALYRRQSSHRLQEAMDRRDRLPFLIILVRHGESEGNADHTLYRAKPDNLVELTEKGIQQARLAGTRIEDIFTRYDEEQQKGHSSWRHNHDDDSSVSSLEMDEVDNEQDHGVVHNDDDTTTNHSLASASSTWSWNPVIKRVHLVLSPFERTRQTAAALRPALEHRIVRTDVQPRIREQEFGNLQGEDFTHYRREQKRVGRFWYRFPTGESGSDVSDRVQSWWYDSVLNVNERVGYAPIDALVVVTHGLTMRFVLMQLYGWSPTTFHSVWNADNCDIYVLKKDLSKPGLSPYILDETLGGNMPRSSIDVIVEFHNTPQEEESDKDSSPQNPKKFKLSDYLSIPPPRTKQIELVKEKLVKQYPEEIDSVARIKSIVFVPFVDGPPARSISGLFPQEEEDEEEDNDLDNPSLAPNGIVVEGKVMEQNTLLERRGRHSGSSRKKSKTKFPYYPEVLDESWRSKQTKESVIAERNYR